jgi:uncharacterized protein YegJ (DUF2314 family)
MKFPFFGAREPKPVTIKLPEIVHTGFGVYFTSDGPPSLSDDDIIEITKAWLIKRADPRLGDAITDFVSAAPMRKLEVRPVSQLAAPPMQMLKAMGLGETEEERMRHATHVVMVATYDALRYPRFGLIAAVAVARALALKLGGVIFDPQCGKVLRIDTHDQELPDTPWLPVATQIVIPHSVDSKGIGWMTTVGMEKYGLPNLELRQIPPNLGDAIAPIMSGIIQKLVWAVFTENQERGTPSVEIVVGPDLEISSEDISQAFGTKSESGEKVGTTQIRIGYYPDKRGEERFLGVMPPEAFKNRPEEWMYLMLDDLLGREDKIGHVNKDSEMMEAAHYRATAELPEVKRRFLAKLPVGSNLFIKHGFPTSDGDREFMWIAVQTWTGDKISGILANEPLDVPGLRAGSPVQISEAEAFDWTISHHDGRMEGGYTTKVMEG